WLDGRALHAERRDPLERLAGDGSVTGGHLGAAAARGVELRRAEGAVALADQGGHVVHSAGGKDERGRIDYGHHVGVEVLIEIGNDDVPQAGVAPGEYVGADRRAELGTGGVDERLDVRRVQVWSGRG